MPVDSAARPKDLTWLPPHWENWSLPDPKVVKEQLKNEFTEEERTKAWDNAATAVKTYHDELIEQWQKAMDSVLVYAGLFSAVLTAFNVQSYQLLQPDPTDPMVATLQQISAQLNSFSINPSFINSTQPARSPDQLQLPFRAPVSAVWINTLWFASLVCSLASASIALIVKQWLYEMSKGLSGTSRETARLRQYRLNSLIKWRVGAIVLIPSLLLQVALFLFLSGFSSSSGRYTKRSPLAFGVFVVAKMLWNWSIQLASAGLRPLYYAIPPDRGRLVDLFDGLVSACYLGLAHDMPRLSTWNGAEQTEVARDNGFLDRHIATMAYTTTFATEHLKALHVILSDLPCDQVLSCFSDVHKAWVQLWGADVEKCSRKLASILCGQPFYYALRKVLTVDPDKRDSTTGRDWMEVSSGYLLSSYNAARRLPCSGEVLSALALTSIGDSTLAKRACRLLYLRIFYSDDLEDMRFVVTYDVLRDVMAAARYNVEHWVAPDEDDVRHKLWTIKGSLRCTQSALINNVGLSWEQEGWIRDETRSLLSSLTEKMATIDGASWRFYFAIHVVAPLATTCKEVSGGYEMVPEGLFLTWQQILLPDKASREEWAGNALNEDFNNLKSIIRQQKHDRKQHGKPCFRTQQPPAVVF
ncbi:hypothetical protein LXA43DRAFT_1098170 [Ganoderma leucocontextum]|nr:hypothetical protein LXA43DRAFT_1098170 [Ganoderma leucocontextum]